jgi:hypothetical protein
MRVGGNAYQAGDPVVTLAPSAHGQLVTSQRGGALAVDPEAGTLTVSMDDETTHTLGVEDSGPDRLARGYATRSTAAKVPPSTLPPVRWRWRPRAWLHRNEPGQGLFLCPCWRRR